ncbi:MAG TPA: DUF2092 domain-containing protein [Thermodesulfobacteriota bacterium]|nr:DUF2092 domain-containing protein [Thermodesulfobacteriota bacterium]
MNLKKAAVFYFVLAFLLTAPTAFSQDSPGAPGSPSSPVIDPKVRELLQKMGDVIKNSKQFSFHAEILYDDILPSGQKIQFAAAQDMDVKRPDKVFTKYQSDVESREFWYDGKSFTLLDLTKNLYSTVKAEPTIDGTLQEIINKYGYTPALSDFLYSDPYKTLMENVLSGFYVGPGDVNGTECYHLAFVEKYIDWQIWIEAGDKPLVRKVVITYKTVPESPQYTAVFSDWKFNKSLADSFFEPKIPEGAKEIDMVILKNVSIKGGR